MQEVKQITPLMMTYRMLRKSLVPFCHGKKALLDCIDDIWKDATPVPQKLNGSVVKIIFPKHFFSFVAAVKKEVG